MLPFVFTPVINPSFKSNSSSSSSSSSSSNPKQKTSKLVPAFGDIRYEFLSLIALTRDFKILVRFNFPFLFCFHPSLLQGFQSLHLSATHFESFPSLFLCCLSILSSVDIWEIEVGQLEESKIRVIDGALNRLTNGETMSDVSHVTT